MALLARSLSIFHRTIPHANLFPDSLPFHDRYNIHKTINSIYRIFPFNVYLIRAELFSRGLFASLSLCYKKKTPGVFQPCRLFKGIPTRKGLYVRDWFDTQLLFQVRPITTVARIFASFVFVSLSFVIDLHLPGRRRKFDRCLVP